MSNYTKATNFAIKDGLVTTDPAKIIKGTEIDNEYNAISSAISSKADVNSPSLTGTPTAPTATYGTNTTQVATTAFVAAGLAGLVPSGVITLWSGSIASVPTGWVFCNGANSTPDLRDRFVVGAGTTYAVGATGGANSVTLDATMIPGHTHSVSASGTTAAAGDHTHTFSGTSSGQSATHTHSVSDAGHAHSLEAVVGRYGYGGAFGVRGDYPVPSAASLTSTGSATTGITLGNASADHTHTYSGTTSAVTTHTHTVTVTGTSGSTGGGLAHENRPPYYALAFIMKT